MISVEASVLVVIETIGSLAAQIDDDIISGLLDEIKDKCLKKKLEVEKLLSDPDRRAQLDAEVPSYWKS